MSKIHTLILQCNNFLPASGDLCTLQTVCAKIKTDLLSVLMWIQTV